MDNALSYPPAVDSSRGAVLTCRRSKFT